MKLFIVQVGNGRQHLVSRSSKGEYRCSCISFSVRKNCRHIKFIERKMASTVRAGLGVGEDEEGKVIFAVDDGRMD